MKTYRLFCADAFTHVPEHPERTAKRYASGLDFDVTFKVWPSRAALLTTLNMQDKRAPHSGDWRPCVKR